MSRFEKNVFISYAHIDNQPLTSEMQGWITRFHGTLESMLSMALGSTAKIWRDDKLQGNDVFADEIVSQFSSTALLVSVLTPRYLNSEWCTRELHEFCQKAEQSGGVVIDNKSRVFKVVKTPVDHPESLPDAVKDVLGYEFFTYEDGAPMELDSAYGQEYGQAYLRKVNKLANDVKLMLNTLESNAPSVAGDAQATTKPSVYLAESSYDRKEDREILEGDLQRHGYTVLPDRQLPRDEADYVAAVAGLLERCVLSIHLIGEIYGAVPDGPSQKSVVELQNDLAVQRSKSNAMPRVVWLPERTRSEQAQQQAFIDALHDTEAVQYGADLVTASLEDLKAAVHTSLRKLEKPAPAPSGRQSSDGDQAKLIYLICDERDRTSKATVPLRKFLREQGFAVQTPVFEGDAGAVRAAHEQLLTECDSVILFYGAGDEAWMHTLKNELRKMPSYRGGTPVLASYTYLAEPRTADKEDLTDMEEDDLIDGLEGFSDAAMAPFIQAMTSAEKTR